MSPESMKKTIKPERNQMVQSMTISRKKEPDVYKRQRYDLPWIETVTRAEEEGWGKNPAYLHYGSAGVIGIETNADAAAKTYAIHGPVSYTHLAVYKRQVYF